MQHVLSYNYVYVYMYLKDVSPTAVHEEGELRMKFTFMTKKGHKQQLKDLSIPIDSDLASNIHEAREALRDQHQEMKKLVLNYEQKQEEEEYLGEGGRGREREREMAIPTLPILPTIPVMFEEGSDIKASSS